MLHIAYNNHDPGPEQWNQLEEPQAQYQYIVSPPGWGRESSDEGKTASLFSAAKCY